MLRQKCTQDIRALRASRLRATNLSEVSSFSAFITLSIPSRTTAWEVIRASTDKAFFFWTAAAADSCLVNAPSVAGRVARFAVLWPNFRNLAVFQVGWPQDCLVGLWLFWPFFEGRLAENFFCWPFLKICLYFKAKLSGTTPFLIVSSPCVHFAACSELYVKAKQC